MTAAVDQRASVHSPIARALHWIVVVLIAVQVTMGIIMVYEAPQPNFWVRLSDALAFYSAHKLLGIVLLLLVILRLANRIGRGAPPAESTLTTWQREMSALVHAWLYFLLLLVPLLGWIGTSLYPALTVFDWFALPALTAPNRPLSVPVFAAHKIAAFTLIALVGMHVTAALYHHFIRRDGVLGRMLPRMSRRGPNS
ncbi:MAG: cytochrome b/b6 domain-containing protein [Rhodoplanes sp.]